MRDQISNCETCLHGQLYLIGNSLDYERQSSHSLIIKAVDVGNLVILVMGRSSSIKTNLKALIHITNNARYIHENPAVGDLIQGTPIRPQGP